MQGENELVWPFRDWTLCKILEAIVSFYCNGRFVRSLCVYTSPEDAEVTSFTDLVFIFPSPLDFSLIDFGLGSLVEDLF